MPRQARPQRKEGTRGKKGGGESVAGTADSRPAKEGACDCVHSGHDVQVIGTEP